MDRSPGRTARRRSRDRHGRGVRGPLLPPGSPGARTRAERFDDLVLDAAERLARRHPDELRDVEFATEDVPPADPAPWEGREVPMGRLFPATATAAARVVVYRRPVETRAEEPGELEPLVREVVAEQIAHLLGRDPDDLA